MRGLRRGLMLSSRTRSTSRPINLSRWNFRSIYLSKVGCSISTTISISLSEVSSPRSIEPNSPMRLTENLFSNSPLLDRKRSSICALFIMSSETERLSLGERYKMFFTHPSSHPRTQRPPVSAIIRVACAPLAETARSRYTPVGSRSAPRSISTGDAVSAYRVSRSRPSRSCRVRRQLPPASPPIRTCNHAPAATGCGQASRVSAPGAAGDSIPVLLRMTYVIAT